MYIVGAGPGEPGLITVKGLECLKRAEVVIYDRLVDDSLLDAAPANAERIYVGKGRVYHAAEQKDINLLLVAKAREGKMVVRLKGGDPFVLGRGGEEAVTLAANNISFEVVPGVSSATAVPAYAGIPVTDRRLASSFTVVTGHEDAEKGESTIHWDKVSIGSDTLVILMGMENLKRIVDQLLWNGRPKSTPVAVVTRGTSPQQRTVVGTLGNIVTRAVKAGFGPPSVVVVGEVVKLRDKLRWFEKQPLFGKRVLVTRAERQASGLSRLLRERGALPVEMPVLQIRPPTSWKELDQAIRNLNRYGWVIFTSMNAVEIVFERLRKLKLDARQFGGVKIGAIGPATAEALAIRGLHADYVPDSYTSRGFLSELKGKDVKDYKVLLPRADIAGTELTDGLTGLGAEVHQVTVYHTLPAGKAALQGKQMLCQGDIEVITFTSASTVKNLLDILGQEQDVIRKSVLACIGPVTAEALECKGFKTDIVAPEHTMVGLVEALEHYFQGKEAPTDE